jgi:hypothetical protein
MVDPRLQLPNDLRTRANLDCKLPCLLRRLATEAGVALDEPRPSPKLVTFAAPPALPSSSPASPPCALYGPRWGRSRAVNGRSASDKHGEPGAPSVQLRSPFWPSTADHGHRPFRSRTEEVAWASICVCAATGTRGLRRSPTVTWAQAAGRPSFGSTIGMLQACDPRGR